MTRTKKTSFLLVGTLGLLFALFATNAQAKSLAPPRTHLTLHDVSKVTTTTSPLKTKQLQLPTNTLPLTVLRGGGGSTDTPTASQVTGVSIFILIELAIRKLFQVYQIQFPAQLAGCVALFVCLIAVQTVSPGWGDSLSDSLPPGAAFLAKWMGVFFVPGLTMLPLAPS